MIVIRSFVDGVISSVSTWGISSPLDNTLAIEGAERVQINLIIRDDIKQKRELTNTGNHTSFHFLATPAFDSEQQVKEIFLSKEMVGLTKLLTEREMEVLKELYQVQNTKKAATNLHISSRTFSNHRFNITKKLGMPAAEAANFIFECSNVELFITMLAKLND